MIAMRPLVLLTISFASLLCAGAIAQDEPSASTPDVPAVTPDSAPVATETEQPVTPVEEAATPEESTKEGVASAEAEAQTTSETPVEATPDVADKTDTQEDPGVAIPALALDSPIEKDIHDQLLLRKPRIDIEKMPSLFFTVWERDLIITARKGLQTRDPDSPDEPDEAVIAGNVPVENDPRPSMFDNPRDLNLSGIVFHSSKDWVIWLNGKRIAPNALPREILDIKVSKEHIDLKWFDESTNQIFPIRLRAHQRFNLDSRIFLPG